MLEVFLFLLLLSAFQLHCPTPLRSHPPSFSHPGCEAFYLLSAKLILEILSYPAHSIFYPVEEDLTLQFLVKQRGRPFVSYHYIYNVLSAEGGKRNEQKQHLCPFPSNVNCFYLAAAKISSPLDIKRFCYFSALLETLMRTLKGEHVFLPWSQTVSCGGNTYTNLKETFPDVKWELCSEVSPEVKPITS